jgi:predicted thioesterase
MKPSLVPGLRRIERIAIDRPRTIGFLGEEMRVYSTPSMVGDVEYTGLKLVQEHLDEGESSVGIQVEVDHIGATPLGQEVEVEIRVVGVEGRKVSMEAEVRDAVEVVGRGAHVRFVIDVARHRARLAEKAIRLSESRSRR